MAIPMLRASAPPAHLRALFHSNVKKPLHVHRLPCSPPELNPVLQAQKHEVTSESGLSLFVGTHLIPHPNKVDKGGEDAFLVSGFNGAVIAVADGVSGWAEQNVDPSLFSKELIAHALSLLGDEEANYNPRMLLNEAHAATSSIGSATIVVAMLERDGILRIANVGDCGLRVVRGGQIIFSTSPQEHYFDCPYQLSSESVGQTYRDAVVSTVEVIEKDTVIMGSDGLFDNVFDHEIVSILAKHDDVSEAAKALANLAREHSVDSSYDSPYSIEARTRGFDVPVWKKALGFKLTGTGHGLPFSFSLFVCAVSRISEKYYLFNFISVVSSSCLLLSGGKLDDITVIVGQVVRPHGS
ncbi:probable protein phosphatase 2C 26 isoform X1 [Syzygium oleosum]|uniref:probable protein phosphatase 2C 26 isoform X1 n=1 Tax=Syzygium oleosum TaxID=219896 RepID=UPI0024BBD46E|nr:probable protein phosphatase 2C 26 isoform X1 [Syzygium oleosum]